MTGPASTTNSAGILKDSAQPAERTLDEALERRKKKLQAANLAPPPASEGGGGD